MLASIFSKILSLAMIHVEKINLNRYDRKNATRTATHPAHEEQADFAIGCIKAVQHGHTQQYTYTWCTLAETCAQH